MVLQTQNNRMRDNNTGSSLTMIMEQSYDRKIMMTLRLGDLAMGWYSKLLHLHRLCHLALPNNRDCVASQLRTVNYCLQVLKDVLEEESKFEKIPRKMFFSQMWLGNIKLPRLKDLPRMVQLLHSKYFLYLDQCQNYANVIQIAEQHLRNDELMLDKYFHHCEGYSATTSTNNRTSPQTCIGSMSVLKDMRDHTPVKRGTEKDPAVSSPKKKKRRTDSPNNVSSLEASY